MRVKYSQEVKLYLKEYMDSLKEYPYWRSKGRRQELVRTMSQTIREKASKLDTQSNDCWFKQLGQERDDNDKPLNHNLKGFQYTSPSSSVWEVSVLLDFKSKFAIVYRIVPCVKITESPPGWKQQSNDSQQEKVKESNAKWLLLSKFVNRNTMRNGNMKRIRFNESTALASHSRKTAQV